MSLFHLRPLPRCPGGEATGCGAPATQEVYSNRNARYGVFCERCAKRHLARLEKSYEGTDPATMPRT